MSADHRSVIFCTNTKSIIDLVRPSETPAAALQRLADYGTAHTILPIDEAIIRYEAAFKSPPVAIDEARWNEMLGVLPPVGWTNHGDTESFKLMEHTAGSITAIFARIGD